MVGIRSWLSVYDRRIELVPEGMQRFGTAAIPTHTIGLAFLKSDWHQAISLILRPRPGEHPEVVAARKAWLDEGDLDKALELMPRRVVAERCILESYKKQGGDTRNAMGALSTVSESPIYSYSSSQVDGRCHRSHATCG